eukprot:g88.t1
MEAPECECIVQNDRVVNLGEVSGGLEPYTIQYGGVKLDINSDGVADDVDGEYVFDAANGHDITDFVQDLGNLLVDYTQPTWSFTVVDARGCELDYTNYAGDAAAINYGECVETTITVTDVYAIADLNLLLEGSSGDFGNLTFTLISPNGTEVELLREICSPATAFNFTLDGDPEFGDPILDNCLSLAMNEVYVPVGNIEAFNGEPVQGDWTLQIAHNGAFSVLPANLTAWSLDISARDPYDEEDMVLENDLDECGAIYTWNHPILFDNCPGGSVQMTITFEDGTVEEDVALPIFAENTTNTYFFQVGETEVEYTLTDAAGNTSTCGFVVTVNDTQFPEITCPADLVIQLEPGECETIMYPTTPVYEYDNCPDYTLSSFPAGTPVPIGDTVITLIITDASGNVTECTYNLTVLEHVPTGDIACVQELNLSLDASCEAELIEITEVHDFVIDFPEDADADCGDPEIPTIITETDGCDVLSVNIGDPVRFSATGDECYKLSITYDVINWCLWDGEYTGHVIPRMTEDDGEALPIDRAVEGNERPVVRYDDNNGLCIDRRHNDRDGDSGLDNCEDPVLPNYGRYIYTQFVKVYDSTAPVVTVGEYGGPTDNCPDLVAGQFGDDDGDCEEPVSIPFSVADDCELFDNDGNLVVSIVSAELDAFAVDANEDGDIKSNEFVADLDVADLITDNGDGTYSFDGTFPIITSAMGDNIYHAVRILFEDGCGNQVSEYIVFDVIDCKGPAPVCINGLTVTLMPQEDGGCAMAIWASDFEGSPISDCTGQGPEIFLGNPRVTKYAIYRAADVEADPNFVPSPDDTGLVLTQDDESTTVVYVYAFDEEGNYDYCETYVLVQQNPICNGVGTGVIAGVIMTDEQEAVEGVEVNLSGGMVESVETGVDGSFDFNNLPLGGDYTLTPYLNANPLNGVSTFDLVLISKHILGVQALDSPYKQIAADVNQSESVTTLDMIQLRKLILNIDTEFQSNTSWRFIDANYSFPEPTDPWLEEFPEISNVNNLSETTPNADFIAVKIGDVNGSAQANALVQEERNLNGETFLELEEVEMRAGNTYTVAVTAKDFTQLQGFQGTLQLTGVELLELEYAEAKAEHFGFRYAEQGFLTMSWNASAADMAVSHDEGILFSLVLRANTDIALSEAISINSRYTTAEAYRSGNTMELGLSFTNALVVDPAFALYQNAPNPFRSETMISFNLPEDCEVDLTITDMSGQGVVLDENDQPVIGANVFLAGTYDGTSTDLEGAFSFQTTEAGEWPLTITYLGYESWEAAVNCDQTTQAFSIKLLPATNELDAVVITAGAFEAGEGKKSVTLNTLDIVTTAGASGDVIGALQTLPGAQRVGEDGRLFVRGGAAYETKTFIDGAYIAQPYTSTVPNVPARGRFSPTLFEGTTFSTGGYSAAYGQALSSALILESEGLASHTLTGISLMSVGGSLSHTQRWENTSVSVAADYTNLSPYMGLVPQNITWDQAPRTTGGQFIFRHRTENGGLFKVQAQHHRSSMALRTPNPQLLSDTINVQLENDYTYAGFSYQTLVNDSWSLKSTLAYTRHEDRTNTIAQIQDQQDALTGNVQMSRSFGEKHLLRAGVNFIHEDSREELVFEEFTEEDQITDPIVAAYLEDDWTISNKLVARIGLRAEQRINNDETSLSPRLSVAYKTGEYTQFSLAGGRFIQSPTVNYLYRNSDLESEEALHLLANWQWQKSGRTLRLEAYHKAYENLVVRNNDALSNQGGGYARGLDVYYRDKLSLRNSDFWVSYNQSDRFTAAMSGVIEQMENPNPMAIDWVAITNKLERIAKAEPAQWLPHYYLAYASLQMAMQEMNKGNAAAVEQLVTTSEQHLEAAKGLTEMNTLAGAATGGDQLAASSIFDHMIEYGYDEAVITTDLAALMADRKGEPTYQAADLLLTNKEGQMMSWEIEVKPRDSKGELPTVRRYAFLLESTKQLEDRLGLEECEDCLGVQPDQLNREAESMHAVFQYMIGNADFNLSMIRNLKLLGNGSSQGLIPVGYDFDFSGLVMANYAVAASHLGQTQIGDRVFLGLQVDDATIEATLATVESRRDELFQIIRNQRALTGQARAEMRIYLKSFFEHLEELRAQAGTKRTFGMSDYNQTKLKDAIKAMLDYYKLKGKYQQTRIKQLWTSLMGPAISQYTTDLKNGFQVTVIDISATALEKALSTITRNLDRLLSKERISEDDKTATLERLSTSTDMKAAVANADLVVEAATENVDLKLKIFQQLDEAAPEGAVLATNTSSISITKIAAVTKRPEKVIGMHFMNPVPIMKLVEVIRGYATSDEVTAQIMELSKQLGKVPVEVNDYPGFVANRILMPMINEAIYSLYEGVAGVSEIDTVMKLGMAHPMGPLQLADFIGLDVCLSILRVLHDGFGNPKYAPCPLLVNMVTAGKLGAKSGEGFYTYGHGTKELIVAPSFAAK